MFLGRSEEINIVKEFLEGNKTLLAVYGRRRVGKTSLVLEALSQTEGLVLNYTCEKGDYSNNINRFSERIRLALNLPSFPSFTNFRDLFSYLRTAYRDSKIVVFLDEFPYLFDENLDDPRVSEFQAIVDESKNSNLKMILCGSSVHFMSDAFGNYANPLYGRADRFLELRPFSFLETKEFFKGKSFRDIFLAYGVSGGIPLYLETLLSYKNIDEALKNECFSYNGYFYMEAVHFLKSEFDDTKSVEKILSVLGSEERTTSEIASRAGIKVNGINYHLNKLASTFLIKKVENAFVGKTKETRWRIADPFFRFYYGFIAPNADFIALAGKDSYKAIFTPEAEALFLSRIYEAIAPELVVKLASSGKIPFIPKIYRKWRGKRKTPEGIREVEIDGVFYDEKNVLFVECKYRHKVVGQNILDDLAQRSKAIDSDGRKPYFLLMSLNGFTPELQENLGKNVYLIEEDRLV